ncbi:MAG: DUF1565 domain-containing protein, partial [Bacteroidales bacterium]|nr:DUF1565 domain-containing protein [Candidatus Scybalocola fimicaballi]
MMNTTFVDNETDYPTYLYLYNSPVINSIVVGNKASLSSMYPVQLSGSNTIGNSMFDVPVSGGNVIIASKENAAFKDPENGDYSLTEKSYCINRGCDVEYTADLYGNARKQKGAVDMGAIESSYDKCALPSYGDIVYVKAGSNGDGSSWKSAFGDVSQAVKMVSVDGKKHQIWVAAGTYYGDTLSAVSLYLHDGISLYGGFAGNETSLASRDTAKNRTILDGMKARCVIAQISSFADSMSVTVDGFTIQNGASSSACALKISGGVTINNCIIKGNVGPKIYGNSTIDAAYAIIKNTKIINNRYETCYNYYTARLDHCVMDSCDLINNSAYYYGAVYADYSEITNCKIDGNISTGSGNSGSYFNYTSVSNCRFANASGSGATVYVQSYSTLKECLFENNTAINRYLIYQLGTNSLVEDCKFINNSSNATLLYVVKGKINRCTIKGDSTTSRLIEASNAGTIISNCLICDNVSTSTTEQPISLNKEASMINCTVVNNETGSNYVGLISNSTLKNSIIVGNKTNIADGNVLTQSGVNSISNNMLENYVSGGNLSGNMEYAAFKDAENGDYSLSETSYCINAGTSVSDSLDLNGNPRTQMGSVDLGAIESQFDRTKVPTMSEIIYVKSGSEGDGSSWNSAFGDVSQAIKVASLDGKRHQVWVAAGTYYGDTLSTYPSIYLEKGISLYGGFAGTETSIAQRDTAKNPTILDGKGKRGVIIQNYPFADSMAVIVDGFTIQNGYATTGAGVNIKNNTTVSNCIVKKNLVTGNGSAVYAFNASVKNSKIFNNTGSYSNVAVYLQNAIMDSCDVRNNTSYYGTVLNASKNSIISGCTFEANNMSYSYSYSSSYRGIRVDSSNVKNCKFINSNGLTASVWLTGNSVMSGCLFDGNTSSSNLVYVQSGNALIEDCKFLNNKVSSSLLCLYSGSCKRCLVKGDTTSNRLIEMKGSSISNSLICNNVGTNSSYELVYIADKASMYNCTVVDNETKSNVFYMNNATLVNTIAIGNKSVKNINGIVNQGTVANSFANNMLEHTFLNRSLEGKTEYAAFTDAANGDYSLSENSFCINAGLDVADSLDFFGNPRKQGGAVDMGAIESAHTKSASFANLGEIIYVKAGSDGDGSSWTSAFGEIQPAIFAASTDGKKHQIWVAAGTYYGDSTLSSVVNLVSGVSLYGGFAGTETTLASRDTAKNPTILDGKSAKRVISQNYGFADSMAVVVDGFTIQNGKAASGAGAYINGNTTISNCIIKANTASSIGSAVYATNATIKKSQIFGNNYTNSLNSTVRLVGSVMDSCVVKNNKAYYNGAVYAEKNSKVSNCEFEGNSCYNNNRGSYFNASEVSGCKFVNSTLSASAIDLQGVSVMSDCLFEKNTNVRTSLVSVGKDALIKECKILDNTATSELLNLNNGKAERCLVKGNNTSSRLVMISSAAASMTNSLICNNVSTYTNDGAVYINNGASMINCTVVSNDTKCSYVVTVNNGSTLKNSIFVDNKKGNRYNGALTSGGTNANTISNNMFESTFVDGNLDGSLEYAAFIDAANGDYSLSENSYCINAGAEVSDSLDYLGNARVQSNAVDMGAFESKYTKAPVLTAGEIVYVKSGSDGDGSSWTSAFGDIQEAIFAASLDHKKHQIWVAAGTYYGDSIRSAVVNLASGISLYGGFAGDETSLAARDTAKNPTVIDGKGVKRVLSQNFGFADSLAVVVDGFTIQNGYAESGAGISVSSNTTISNCIIKNNKASSNGSAIYAYGAVIKNSQISDNTYTSSMNGTVRLSNSVMDSCVVKNNKGYYYGAINADNNSKVTNCEIVGNSSSYNKGSYFNSAKVSNCKFINTSGIGSTVELQGSTVMDSCLFEGNTNVGTNIIYVGNGALAKNCQIIDSKSTSTLVNLNYGKINRCLIQGNTASYRLIEMNYSPALASNTMFVNNICTQSYEPIY